MSGHSKWANIKRKKEVQDKEKSKIFSKISHVVALAIKEGGGITDPEKNSKLRLAIEKAKEFNMPKDNIDRIIERVKGILGGQLKEVAYEGFGTSGTSLIVVAVTDNSTRTFNQVKQTMEKFGGKVASQGATKFIFEKCGLAIFDRNENTEDEILTFVDKINAFDIQEKEDGIFVYFPFENLGNVKGGDVYYRSLSTVIIKDDQIKKMHDLIEALEGLDDVQKVYSNYSD